MESNKSSKDAEKQIEYAKPEVVDYGTLVDLTQVGGSVPQHDVPHGMPNSAYPS